MASNQFLFRYYGHYSNVARGNRKKQDQDDLIPSILEPDGSSEEFRKNWAEMMAQEYTDFDDHRGKYGAQVNPEAWSNWMSVASYFHGIGVLLKEGLIDINLLDQLLVNMVLVSWNQMEPIVKGFRDYTKGSGARFEGRGTSKRHPHFSGFEYLYNELRKREDSYPS